MDQVEFERQIINLQLSVAEVNVIIKSLGKHPFDEIASLIAKIKQQGQKAINELSGVEESVND